MQLCLAEHLVRRGHEVTIVTTSDTGDWFGRIEDVGGRALHISGRHTRHPVLHALRCARTLRAGDYDIILLSNSERFVHGAVPILPPTVAAIPWIHSDTEDAYRKAGVHRQAWNVAVAVSPKVARTARSLLGRPVEHIANGIRPPECANNRRPMAEPGQNLLYVGRLDDRGKGVLRLPDILAAVHETGIAANLRVVGEGADRSELERRFTALGLTGAVTMCGALPYAKVFAEYLSADILLMPSNFEGMPVAAIEAQWCGCVPVVSRLEGVTDQVVRHDRSGVLVERGDCRAFAASAAALLRDPDRWKQYSEAGRIWAKDSFGSDRMGQRFEELFVRVRRGAFPAPGRRRWNPIALDAFTWHEWIPRSLRRLGLGRQLRGEN